ncbi:hypothetical protein Cpir12675_006001 [Ceratocystis pirilliformis]|uniref:Uncharacterized protein n=1 Tax=Ceratocystis pirilliformis TaxID=259994 RepID=A0ABR3YLY5_9PEZI
MPQQPNQSTGDASIHTSTESKQEVSLESQPQNQPRHVPQQQQQLTQPLNKTHSSSRISQQRPVKQKPHVAGRLHARVPSSKGLHNTKHKQSNAASTIAAVRPPNRRTQSEQRLTHTLSNVTSSNNNNTISATGTGAGTGAGVGTTSSNSSHNLSGLKKAFSQTAIARNKSNSEFAGAPARRHAIPSKSSLATKRIGSTTNCSTAAISRTSRINKNHVLFDVGTGNHDDDDDDDDDNDNDNEDDNEDSEWQDASTSASPYISKHQPQKPLHQQSRVTSMPQVHMPRTPVSQAPTSQSTLVASDNTSSGHDINMPTSRFIDAKTSTIAREGSFYTTHGSSEGANSVDKFRRIRASAETAKIYSSSNTESGAILTDDEDASALPIRRGLLSAQKSRTQQKLDLQRASSVMDVGDSTGPHNSIDSYRSPGLIIVTEPGYDGSSIRDPRVTKLLEHIGAGYTAVRRYQNPLARCVERMPTTFSLDRFCAPQKRAAHGATPSGTMTPDSYARHIRRASTSSRPGTAKLMHHSSNGFDEQRTTPMNSAPVLGDEEVTVELQNLWDKAMDLGVSQ